MTRNSGDYTAGDIKGMNHTDVAIIISVSMAMAGKNIVPFGGGYCCVMLPDKWHSGLKARIEWGITPNTVPLPPLYKDWDKYQAREKKTQRKLHSTYRNC